MPGTGRRARVAVERLGEPLGTRLRLFCQVRHHLSADSAGTGLALAKPASIGDHGLHRAECIEHADIIACGSLQAQRQQQQQQGNPEGHAQQEKHHALLKSSSRTPRDICIIANASRWKRGMCAPFQDIVNTGSYLCVAV